MARKIPLDISGIARRQLHVVLALDCSGSMKGDRMASLNYAMRTALPELREVAAENPEIDVRLRVLRFATGAHWHIEEPIPVEDAEWEDLVADGETDMGEALRELGKALSDKAMPGRQLPPVIVMASDGYPTDDYQAGLAEFLKSNNARCATRLGICIGSDADAAILQEFIGNEQLKPLRASNASELVQHIKWATTAPVKATSSPSNDPDPLAPLAREADLQQTPESDIIW